MSRVTICCYLSLQQELQERREAGLGDDDLSDTESRPLSERVGAIDGG